MASDDRALTPELVRQAVAAARAAGDKTPVKTAVQRLTADGFMVPDIRTVRRWLAAEPVAPKVTVATETVVPIRAPEQTIGEKIDAALDLPAGMRVAALLQRVSDWPDDQLISEAARQVVKASLAVSAVIAASPLTAIDNPESVGKMLASIADALERIGSPYQTASRLREINAKTIEVLAPTRSDADDDPLAASLKQFTANA